MMMKKILLLFLAMLTAMTASTQPLSMPGGFPACVQKTVVSGTVVNKQTGQPVSGASITADGFSLVTNDDGRFVLKSDSIPHVLTVSHVGFRSRQIRIDHSSTEQLKIEVEPIAIQLREILVMADNPRLLMLNAISRIKKNYSSQPELYKCFYRETAMKRQHYICVAEGVIDMYKTSYTHDYLPDRVAIVKGRRLLSQRQKDTLGVKVLGGPVTPLYLDIVKNTEFMLNEKELDCYDLKMETPTTISDRYQYVVSIAPRVSMPYALYFGKFYIDQETLAFTRAELSLDMSNREKATQLMLIRKPAGVRFRPKELSMLIDYRLGDDGVTRISYLRTTIRFNCDWRRKLFATSFTANQEMAVTNRTAADRKLIKGRDSFDQRDAFFDKVDYFYDATFWNDYNIIEPTLSLDKAVHKLLKKKD